MRPELADARAMADAAVGYLLARGALLVLTKAFLEPAAVWAGRQGWRWADRLLGDRLPDWIPPEKP